MSPRSEGSKSNKKNEPQPPANDESARPPGPFDVRTVKALVALMTQNDLSEIDLRDGPQRLRLRRGALKSVIAQAPAAPVAPPAQAAPAPAKAEAAAPPSRNLLEIKSPTPGTFYAGAKPTDPPFVKVGAKVTADSVVCIIEAMKIFNEIQAEVSGVIVEVLAENQQSVEYGTLLFRVDPAG